MPWTKEDGFREKNRFDLEQEIMDCWHVTDDIDILAEHVLERNLDVDTITNALIGMKTIYQMKFERLFETFETLVRNRKLDQDDIIYSDYNGNINDLERELRDLHELGKS